MTRSSDLACVAAMLQAAAQTLLEHSQPSQPCPSNQATAPEHAPASDQARGRDAAPGDQYRSYRVPFHILDEEQELLAEYKTNSMAQVLQEIYAEFFLLRELMQGYAERNEDRDFTYALLAKRLGKPLEKLCKVCSVLVDFERQPPAGPVQA